VNGVPESNGGTGQKVLSAPVAQFVERALSLDDQDREALAVARGAVDEAFHLSAWRSANAILGSDPAVYLEVRQRIADAFLPRRLAELVDLGPEADPKEVERWLVVARLARLAVDDALMGLLAADSIRPPDLRELYAPWKAMLAAAHRRRTTPQ
jgi:hypothetical protein